MEEKFLNTPNFLPFAKYCSFYLHYFLGFKKADLFKVDNLWKNALLPNVKGVFKWFYTGFLLLPIM